MMKFLTPLFLISALAGCDVASGVMAGLESDRQANADKPRGVISRALVEESGLAVITATRADQPQKAIPLIALSFNNNVANFGEEGRVFIGLRGGLAVEQYFMGNDLLGVDVNAADPVQFPRPISAWPAQISRIYHLPGEGLGGEKIKVNCQYENLGAATIEIVEMTHQTHVMAERCSGDRQFENRYMVDPMGAIWRSEQWAGENPAPMLIDVVEPLE